jgi:hypothetical protein
MKVAGSYEIMLTVLPDYMESYPRKERFHDGCDTLTVMTFDWRTAVLQARISATSW